MIGEKILSNAANNLSTRAAKEQGTFSRMLTGTRKDQSAHAQTMMDLATEGNFTGAVAEATGGLVRHATAKDMEGMGKARVGAVASRAALAAGGYGALALGTRYATGGTAGYNNSGQRDIAGIPFM